MSENNEAKPKEAGAAAAPAPAKPKGGGLAMVLGMLIPGVLSAAGSFGGVRAAGHPMAAHHAEAPTREVKPPGPTIALEPFLVAVLDASKKSHPMKLTVAIEFESTAKEEGLKPFIPRIRDAILAYMRSLSFEDAVDQEHASKLREELLERCHKAGANAAERVLITDLVSQ